MKVQHIKSIALFQKRELIYVKLKYKYDIEISIIRSYTKSTIHMNITINNKLIVGHSSQFKNIIKKIEKELDRIIKILEIRYIVGL